MHSTTILQRTQQFFCNLGCFKLEQLKKLSLMLAFATMINCPSLNVDKAVLCLSDHNIKGANMNNRTMEYGWPQNKDYLGGATC